jgi:hypothetical protein
MTKEQQLQRCGKYQIFLEDDNNLILFRKIYDMKRFDLIMYLQRCAISIQHNIKLTRDEKVFLNEMERCRQRVLKNEVKSHEYLEDVPEYKPTI